VWLVNHPTACLAVKDIGVLNRHNKSSPLRCLARRTRFFWPRAKLEPGWNIVAASPKPQGSRVPQNEQQPGLTNDGSFAALLPVGSHFHLVRFRFFSLG